MASATFSPVPNAAAITPRVDFLADPPMNLTQRKGRYGVVYLRALAGQAGCTIDESAPGEDVQAIDAKVGFAAGDVFVQVKTTHQHSIADSSDIKFYPQDNWLRKWEKLKNPAYFVVVVVPDDSGLWLDHVVTGTNMKDTAAFWVRIDVPAIRAAESIVIPRSQRLSALTLPGWETDLLARFTDGS